jgi:ABC-type Fe3+-hydroxamate transport system substrate-binding protein
MRLILQLLMLSVLLVGALPVATMAQDTYTDATGVEIALGLDAQRIVSLAPNVTEMVCYLGFRDHLVGRTDYCDFPPDVEAVPIIGGFVDTSLEAIIACDPDLVVAYRGNSLELIGQLRELGVTVLALDDAASLEEIAAKLDVIAAVVGSAQAEAKPGGSLYREQLAGATPGEGEALAPFTVFYGYPEEMMYSCAPGTFIGDLIKRVGGENVINDGSVAWPQVSAEFLLAADPDVILTGTSCTADEDPVAVRERMLAGLRADPVWSGLAAIEEGRLIVIDADILHRPGPRIIDALIEFRQQLQEVAPELAQQSLAPGGGGA